jgi:hypothetical protein
MGDLGAVALTTVILARRESSFPEASKMDPRFREDDRMKKGIDFISS